MALINGASFTRMVLRYAPLERLPARFRKQVNSSKADAGDLTLIEKVELAAA